MNWRENMKIFEAVKCPYLEKLVKLSECYECHKLVRIQGYEVICEEEN